MASLVAAISARWSEADATLGKGRRRQRQLRQLLTHGHPVPGRPGTHAAVDPDPVDGADEAAAIPLVGLREAPGELGELDLEQIDHVAQLHELVTELEGLRLAIDDTQRAERGDVSALDARAADPPEQRPQQRPSQ